MWKDWEAVDLDLRGIMYGKAKAEVPATTIDEYDSCKLKVRPLIRA
jgi:hypothetical protein